MVRLAGTSSGAPVPGAGTAGGAAFGQIAAREGDCAAAVMRSLHVVASRHCACASLTDTAQSWAQMRSRWASGAPHSAAFDAQLAVQLSAEIAGEPELDDDDDDALEPAFESSEHAARAAQRTQAR